MKEGKKDTGSTRKKKEGEKARSDAEQHPAAADSSDSPPEAMAGEPSDSAFEFVGDEPSSAEVHEEQPASPALPLPSPTESVPEANRMNPQNFPTFNQQATDTVPPPALPTFDPQRLQAALGIIEKYALIAGATGFIPAPILNFGAVWGIEIKMISELAKHYGQKASSDTIKAVLYPMLASGLHQALGVKLGRLAMSAIPLIGPVIGIFSVPFLAYAATRIIGKIFAGHFATGGTLLDFDPLPMGEFFASEFGRARNQQQANTVAPPPAPSPAM